MHYYGREVVVWDPLTGQQHHVPFPPELRNARGDIYWSWHAAVLCADDDDGHVHGDCFSSPFKLVLIHEGDMQAQTCLYDSSSGVWGDFVSTTITDSVFMMRPSILVGNTLCWSIHGGDVLAFDVKTQSLGVIEKPTDNYIADRWLFQLLRMEDGGLGFALLSETIQLWERKPNCDGVVRWVLLQKTIPLDGMLSWGIHSANDTILFTGYDEDTNVVVLATRLGNFMLQLGSIKIKHIIKRNNLGCYIFYPYTNFYTAGNTFLSTLHTHKKQLVFYS
jgi:hypothetical protein